jgi:proteic killer suppression protein
MIRSFRDRKVEAVALGQAPRGFPPDLVVTARRKLKWLDSAASLRDLASPPGNRLESLSGDRQGQHSIRINDQWRICFRWSNGGADDVEIVDYH